MSADRPSERAVERRVGGPARGYSWPPFAPGNEVAKTHGSYVSEVRLSTNPVVLEIAEWIAATQPVSHEADAGTIARLAVCYYRLQRANEALEEVDRTLAERPLTAYDDHAAWLGRLREDADRWNRVADRLETQLARNPAARAKVGLHIASARRALTVVDLHAAAALEADAEEVET